MYVSVLALAGARLCANKVYQSQRLGYRAKGRCMSVSADIYPEETINNLVHLVETKGGKCFSFRIVAELGIRQLMRMY